LTASPLTGLLPAHIGVPAPRQPVGGVSTALPKSGHDYATRGRTSADGRHLLRDGRPFRARGVTYGGFAPRSDGAEFPEPGQLRRDLTAMAALGFNAVRTYTLPPVDLLDTAAEVGLVVHAGLHYNDWRAVAGTGRRIHRTVLAAGLAAVEQAAERLAGRAEVLAVSVGNEVPADLVRLHGAVAVERTLGRLVDELHAADDGLLVSYGTYPSTEYLQVPELDLVTANVFLADPAALQRYLRHLAVAVGDLPLLVGELGIQLSSAAAADDSREADEAYQADQADQAGALQMQLDVVDETGVAGAFVFSWTDDWVVGGEQVTAWRFGLTDTARRPRIAAAAAGSWAQRSLRAVREDWPRVSVVVCAYNEASNLEVCLDSLMQVDYPELEVVVVDDGSTDETLNIARRFPFHVLAVPHAGLSVARNAGTRECNGEIVAFLDADAACHPEWPYHLALSMEDDGVAATGGPNLPRPDAGLVERAVHASPGNPVEVLSKPDRAEHLAGCNCAVRRDLLLACGGFQADFTSAGDDVDLFWRLLDSGNGVGFSPAAQVRHARRATVRKYLRQQRGYGRAERMVSGRHPHRFNRSGQAVWAGSLYGGPASAFGHRRSEVDYGPSGTAAYQPALARGTTRPLDRIPALLPGLAAVAVGALLVGLLVPAALLLAAAAGATIAGYAAIVAAGTNVGRHEGSGTRLRLLAGLLHVLQPLARARGRRSSRPLPPLGLPVVAAGDRVGWVDAQHVVLAGLGCRVRRGGVTDRHDLVVAVGWLLRARLTTGLRWGAAPVLGLRWRPGPAAPVIAAVAGVTALAACTAPRSAGLTQAWLVIALVVVLTAVLGGVEMLVLRTRISRAAGSTAPHTPRRAASVSADGQAQ